MDTKGLFSGVLLFSVLCLLPEVRADKCSRSIKQTRRILIYHVKPGLRKSSSTSSGISTDGLSGRAFFNV